MLLLLDGANKVFPKNVPTFPGSIVGAQKISKQSTFRSSLRFKLKLFSFLNLLKFLTLFSALFRH